MRVHSHVNFLSDGPPSTAECAPIGELAGIARFEECGVFGALSFA